MAAEWIPVFNMKGFDKDAAPRWQMVPCGGDRFVALRDGAGLTVTSTDPNIVTVTEINMHALPPGGERRMLLHHSDRIFQLRGKAKGNAKIQVTQAAALTSKTELEVDTKNRKTVKVCFNFLQDSAGHYTARDPASARQWVKGINAIYNGQANVIVELLGARPVIAKDMPIRDLGEVLGNETPAEFNALIALGDMGANLNVFLVWKYEYPGVTADAVTLDSNGKPNGLGGKIVYVQDTLTMGGSMSMTIAHEMGHHLGAADRSNAAERDFLMFGSGNRKGVYLPKADVNIMNQESASPTWKSPHEVDYCEFRSSWLGSAPMLTHSCGPR